MLVHEPPTTLVSTPLSFRISSLLMVIAVNAVCLGVAHENIYLGIILSVAIAPALVYTVVVAERRKARRSPMAFLDKAVTLFLAIVGVVIIEISALVAFFMTCVSVAYVTAGSGIALVAGGIAGVASLASAIYLLLSFRKGRRTL